MDAAIELASPVYRGMNITATTLEDLMTWASLLTHDLNDFILWKRTDASGNITYTKFRYDGEDWVEEFTINSNSFTVEQWAAINSGITEETLAYILQALSEAATEVELQGKLDNTPKGNHTLPIYIKFNPQTGHGEAEVIDSLHTPGDIHSDSNVYAFGGVAAGGIVDLDDAGRGGSEVRGTVKGVRVGPEGSVIDPDAQGIVEIPEYPDEPTVVRYDNLNPSEDESTSKVATAKATAILKEQISIESLDLYDTTRSYKRGDLFRVVAGAYSIGYRVKIPIEAGANSYLGSVERLTYETLARPLNIVNIDNILT